MNPLPESKRVFIGLGSNLKEPVDQIKRALHTLGNTEHIRLMKASSLYRSAAVGPAGQPDYINAVAELHTLMQPRALLRQLQAIETQHGRERRQHWGARTLDLDILLFADEVIQQAGLVVPHPHMAERNFVLIPLLEITDDSLEIPQAGRLKQLLARCRDNPIVKLDA